LPGRHACIQTSIYMQHLRTHVKTNVYALYPDTYEEEDTCNMRRRIHVKTNVYALYPDTYEEEDTCNMRRRIHVKTNVHALYPH